MRYVLKCDKCSCEELYEAPIKEGPPQDLPCAHCDDGIMRNQFGTNFVLKGENWPGKEVKKKERRMDKEVECDQERHHQHKNTQSLQDEVLAERRKGRNHYREWRRKHPSKARRYTENLNRGIKGK